MPSTSNYLKKIAIVGAGGHSGGPIAKALIASGKFEVTAISRPDSTSAFPSGITNVVRVDHNNHEELVQALRGQDALIITLFSMAPPDVQPKLITAAAEAGVPWVLPNEWSQDTNLDSPEIIAYNEDMLIKPLKSEDTDLIRSLGKSKYLAVIAGFWYEWSLHIAPEAYGFDFTKKEVTFYDEGETIHSTTTWSQVGRGVAALLSLPVQPESEADKTAGRFLENFANKRVYISSFNLSQKDMFESVLRVTGDSREAWTVKKQGVEERYNQGLEKLKTGDSRGFIQALYVRSFYPDGCGNYAARRTLANGVLGLPEEDLDDATANSFGMIQPI